MIIGLYHDKRNFRKYNFLYILFRNTQILYKFDFPITMK